MSNKCHLELFLGECLNFSELASMNEFSIFAEKKDAIISRDERPKSNFLVHATLPVLLRQTNFVLELYDCRLFRKCNRQYTS